jgi:hypothetical protein
MNTVLASSPPNGGRLVSNFVHPVADIPKACDRLWDVDSPMPPQRSQALFAEVFTVESCQSKTIPNTTRNISFGEMIIRIDLGRDRVAIQAIGIEWIKVGSALTETI